ncbi:MAG: hypothetical protein J6W94_02785 [Bacteroidales bacterium]|nr:hypothetical protein [Bacteroidales bacterium]
MTRNSDIKVPDGYFQNLQQRLQAIPEQAAPKERVHLAPYFAYAASIAILALAGTWILRKSTTVQQEESSAEWSYVSYLAQSMDPDGATYQWMDNAPSDDDIVNYLVNDGLTIEELVSYEEDY